MQFDLKAKLKEFFWLTAGTVIMVLGIYFFKFPNHFSTGGVSGISVILDHYFPRMSAGDFVSIINMTLLLIGFLVFGKGFGIKTAYVSILMSGMISLLERVCPLTAPLTNQPFLELVYGVSLPAIGSAILFNMDASSGGTDIVAMIVKKYSSMDIGRALMVSDCLITFMALVAFGPQTGLYSILGLVIKSVLVDMVMENFNTHKCFHIITANPEPIEEYITHTLNRGATQVKGEGVYSHEDRTVILTVMTRHQALKLRLFVRATDPGAFLLITNTSEIIGKGFRRVD